MACTQADAMQGGHGGVPLQWFPILGLGIRVCPLTGVDLPASMVGNPHRIA